MKICLLGNNLTNLLLANILVKKKILIDIFFIPKTKLSNNNTRTIAISNENHKFLNKYIKSFSTFGWPSENIKIYSEKSSSSELFEFRIKNENNFYLVKYNEFYKLLQNNIKNNKFVKFIKLKKYNLDFLNKKNYNLIINSDQNSPITKKFFHRIIEKKYSGLAYTTLISHQKRRNKTAIQFFTKNGPLAFLPLSETQTSVVFSNDSSIPIEKKLIKNFIKKYNVKYEIKNFSEIQKFNIKFSVLRNYFYKNILCFGDLIHKVHPLAGQGFNMTIRDVNILSKIIDDSISLGINNGETIAQSFEEKTKHINFIYGTGIDFIGSFFKLDNKLDNYLSDPLFKLFKKNNYLNKYAMWISNGNTFN